MKPSPYFATPEARRKKIAEAIEHLRLARDALSCAGAPRSLERVRRALTSAQGAQRNARHYEAHDVRRQLRTINLAMKRAGIPPAVIRTE